MFSRIEPSPICFLKRSKCNFCNLQILSQILCFQHFSGRRRNCYSIAIKAVHRALQFATIGRTVRKNDMIDVSYKT